MKKKILASVLALGLVASLTACGSKNEGYDYSKGSDGMITLTVGASPTPHAQILEQVVDDLAAQNINLKIVEYSDYVVPNTAVEEHENAANYFQHVPYLDSFNEEQGTHLVSVAAIHYEPFGLFSENITDLADLPDGATIAIPNDGSNEARALYLLEEQGLITVDHSVGFAATPLNITDNPKNLQFSEMEATVVARALDSVDAAVVNGNYALEAGLKISDALASEDPDSESAQTYANVIAVYDGDENQEAIQALITALQSDEVRDYINDTFDGAVVPLF